MRKFKKPVLKRRKNDAENEKIPRITNETVAAHREEVIGSARKYIYPLQHSKYRIVLLSTGIFLATLIIFITYCTVALYRLQGDSTFLYRVTQVVPFPIARTGGQFVAYENYLFELRHYRHYYETQLRVDFSNDSERQQLEQFKHRALNKVVNDAYIKQLAKRHGISVSDREVDDQIAIVRSQNRLGSDDRVFEDVIKDYWNWSVDDFKRTLRQQLLAQKVVAELDKDTWQRAEAALNELEGGADFAAVAKKYSDDQATKDNGGEFGFAIDKTSREIAPQAADALFKLKPGEYSEVVNTGYTLEIIKNIETNGDKRRAAHIVFTFEPIDTYINDLKEEQNYRVYIRLPETSAPDDQAPALTEPEQQ